MPSEVGLAPTEELADAAESTIASDPGPHVECSEIDTGHMEGQEDLVCSSVDQVRAPHQRGNAEGDAIDATPGDDTSEMADVAALARDAAAAAALEAVFCGASDSENDPTSPDIKLRSGKEKASAVVSNEATSPIPITGDSLFTQPAACCDSPQHARTPALASVSLRPRLETESSRTTSGQLGESPCQRIVSEDEGESAMQPRQRSDREAAKRSASFSTDRPPQSEIEEKPLENHQTLQPSAPAVPQSGAKRQCIEPAVDRSGMVRSPPSPIIDELDPELEEQLQEEGVERFLRRPFSSAC